MTKVTPLSIGGNSGTAAYIKVDGKGKLTNGQKREIELRVNNHDHLTEENAKLREALCKARSSLSACSIHESRNDGSENRMKIKALDKQVCEIDILLATTKPTKGQNQ